ncbi:outer membrane protein assembly factor BamA [Victivallis sp. Marseille-Q1083]|uniref:outer membrane protein assembly factor BamA n=1 Tax=Victivallis sp. Marseille-Q1083 TaxID=2717288 RepID=UPI0015891680|nr:outer membrane protein assembly factor BamA [Victivallis sp. Marseille-Q1083]
MKQLNKWQLALVMAFGLGSSAWAEQIAEVKIEQQGKHPQKEELLLYNIQQRAGTEYDPAIVREDIARLSKSGYFSDVVFETQELPDGRLVLVFKVQLNPEVSEVIFEGNQKFKTAELRNLVAIQPGTLLNNRQLEEGTRKLREFYRDKGYNEARIIPLVKKTGEQEVSVTFHIEEHLRLKVNDVEFDGATAVDASDMRGAIANRHSYFSWISILGWGLFDSGELELDKARLRDLYWNHGYLDFKVEDITVTPTADDPEYVDINFKIFEGEPYRVSSVELVGNQVLPTDELLALIKLKPDQVFDYALETAACEAITKEYETHGYADVSCRAERQADFTNHTVKVIFDINEGRKYTVNKVVISGNTLTQEKVIRRELVIHDGDLLDPNRVEASKSRLMGMGYFDEVKAVTANADKVGERDVHFEVKEKDFYSFKIGAGYSDFNSLAGMVELSNINMDITKPSNYFLGGGQRMRLQAIGGLERSMVNLDFTEPWLFDLPLRFDFSAYVNQILYDNWQEDRIGGRMALTRRFFDDFTSATLGYKFERVDVKDMSRGLSQELRDLQTHDWVSQVSLLLNRDTRDSLMEPTSGYQVSFLSAAALKILASSHNFYRLEGQGSYYYSFLDKALIWHIGGKIGVIDDFDGDNTVPLYERYFLGGGDTLRGFPYREVSPVDKDDHNVGGSSMLLLTTEISHPIWQFIRGAAFVDAGSVWSNPYSFGIGNFNVGVGYGLRIKVPYLNAPVKLDLAYPVLNNVDGLSSKLRFHFNMGFTWNPR